MTNVRLTAMNIRRASRKLAEARDRAAAAEQALHTTIRIAVHQGTSAADAADAAGLSRARVYQILDATPTGPDPAGSVTHQG